MFDDLEKNLLVPHETGMVTVQVVAAEDFEHDQVDAWELGRTDGAHVHHVTDDLAGFLKTRLTDADPLQLHFRQVVVTARTTSQPSSAVSTTVNRSVSSGEIVPASASASKLITLLQKLLPNSSSGMRSMRPVWISVSVSKNSSSVPKPPGKMATARGAQQEVDLARREIVEVEAELGRDVGVGRLLVRQHDVEADRGRADVGGAAIAGLHDARAAAGDDHVVAVVQRLGGERGILGEAARLVVVARGRLRDCASASRCVAAQAGLPGSGMRAPPNSTTVELMPRSRSRNSGFRYSSWKRTPRVSSEVMNSSSAKASR